MEPRFTKYGSDLGKQAVQIGQKVHEAIAKLNVHKMKMDDDMASIYDIVADADSVDSLDLAMECLATVLNYTIADKDRNEFLELEKIVTVLQADIKEIESYVNNRKNFENISKYFEEKYSDANFDYDFLPVIEDCITKTKMIIDQKDIEWCKRNLFLGNKTRQDVFEWKERIKMLPGYLSDATKAAIETLDKEAEQIISDSKIEDVLLHFNKLTEVEKEKCLNILKNEIMA